MNRTEHLLVILAEECSELAQETAKALRFGVEEQRDLPTSNRERMIYEYSQLVAMIRMLREDGVELFVDESVVEKKMLKVEEYLLYSRELGTLVE